MDQVLRDTLATMDLSPRDRRWISETVFAYFRWLGWLDEGRPLERRLDQALGLADHFARRPESFPDDELVARAVAPWVREVMDLPSAWARALQRPPQLWLRARPGTAAALALKLGGPQVILPGVVADSLRYLGLLDLFRTPEFHRGEFEIQDVASQAVGWCCRPSPGETWWDACAGEGGKTLHLADLMRNKGLLWASDRAEWRLERLRQRAARARVFNFRTVEWDGGARRPTGTLFDGILVDAPCSGVGTWGRNPQARWTTTPADVAELAERQFQLLDHCAPALKPKGRLVYAVCTLTRAETDAVADRFAAAHPELEPWLLPNPWAPADPPAPRRWFWPGDTGGNGMFVAAWRRRP